MYNSVWRVRNRERESERERKPDRNRDRDRGVIKREIIGRRLVCKNLRQIKLEKHRDTLKTSDYLMTYKVSRLLMQMSERIF